MIAQQRQQEILEVLVTGMTIAEEKVFYHIYYILYKLDFSNLANSVIKTEPPLSTGRHGYRNN